ncbi:MAG: PmoA family protein [Sedimentisphaerales bacterium]|nr:PmoA family protein [Sedimentisphaerales bacterium]
MNDPCEAVDCNVIQLITTALSNPIGRSVAAFLAESYYCHNGRWPRSGEELKTFAKTFDTNAVNALNNFCEIADCNIIWDANYMPLADGRLKITFPGIKWNQTPASPAAQDIQEPYTKTIPEPNCVCFQKNQNNIDVLINGKHFTTYRYGSELTKPILYPVKSTSGIKVTRGFPFEVIPGESNDHPHHTGVFFTYDKVNNSGFWNNTKIPPQIKHINIENMTQGDGILSVISRWVGKNGKILLEEKRIMSFSAKPNEYAIDFNIMLTAQDEQVVFGDTKEGMFAIRLADWLREDGGTGEYLNSQGQKNEPNIWGRRAKWVRLEGNKDGQTIGVAILNHPHSVNYPTYWMARGYGLFAANPLGQLEFQKATKLKNPQPFNLTLQPGQSAVFKFRLIIYEGGRNQEVIEQEFKNYAQ